MQVCNLCVAYFRCHTVTVPYNFCQYWHTSRWSLLKFIVGLYVGWYLQGPNDFLRHPIYRLKDLLKHGVHAYVAEAYLSRYLSSVYESGSGPVSYIFPGVDSGIAVLIVCSSRAIHHVVASGWLAAIYWGPG